MVHALRCLGIHLSGFGLTVLGLIALSGAPPGEARQVFDTTDAAFNGAVTVDWPPPELSTNQSSVTFERNGVTFNLSFNLPGPTLGTCDVPRDGISIASIENQGLTLTISPPVEAIGFHGTAGDGNPNGQFLGSADSETIELPPPFVVDTFYGAADIGNIGNVSFAVGFSFFCLHDMVFVPPAAPPTGSADLDLVKTLVSPPVGAANSEVVVFTLDLESLGPDTAETVRLLDLVPRNPLTGDSLFENANGAFDFDALASTVSWPLGDLALGDFLQQTLTLRMPADRLAFSCNSRLLNVATVSSSTADLQLENNLATSTILFQDPLLPTTEICGNNIDDDCDGRFDCADPDCNCRPSLPTPAGNNNNCNGGYPQGLVEVEGLIYGGRCSPLIDTDGDGQQEPANEPDDHVCHVPRGRCGGQTVPAFCCDLGTWSNPSAANLQRVANSCDVGVPGCAPVDPNFKEAEPRTNIAGFGLIGAGETISYTIHYENIGTADATDVRIIDVLDEDLDASTLSVADEGLAWTYDPASRTLIWRDPLLPPATPRSVSFSIDMRADAEPGTRARNDATIVFPTAAEPRTDTNFVEHVVPNPQGEFVAHLSVLRCVPGDASNEYRVQLVNEGLRFAYNVTATVVDAPQGVVIQNDQVRFAHPDDPDPATLASVIPNAVTTSIDALTLNSSHPVDPCEALSWQIDWETGEDDQFNTTQEPAAGRTCDLNEDTFVDINDVRALAGLRNQAVDTETRVHDLDEDGRITVLDARGCVLACDNPRCVPAP
jgi:uncharacterized repeat protein (TIGR01451 family)